MFDLPPEWLTHFGEVRDVISSTVRMPFDRREPVLRVEGNIGVEFEEDPDVRAVVTSTPACNFIKLPVGAYLRSRMIALALTKDRSRRKIPEYFSGTTISGEQARSIAIQMRSPFESLHTLLGATKGLLEKIGNEEPESSISVFGSPAETISYYAVNFLAMHEACHFWYGHFGLIAELVEPFLSRAWSLKEVQADMGAGTSLADHVAADLEVNDIPLGTGRYFSRIWQLSQLAGLAMAITFDLINALHPSPGPQSGYEDYGVRFWISRHGFRKHIVAKTNVEAGECGTLGVDSGEIVYCDLIGRKAELAARASRLREIWSCSELYAFGERQIEHIPGTPDKEALVDYWRAQNEKGSTYDPRVARAVQRLFLHPSRRSGIGLFLNDPGVKYASTRGTGHRATDLLAGDALWRDWIDPLGIVRPALANASAEELRTAAALVATEIGKTVILWPQDLRATESGVTTDDPAFGTFRISIGRGITARLPLILMCLFDRPNVGPLQRDLAAFPEGPLDERYAVLIATAKDTADHLRWWAAISRPSTDGESYELRNGWRYGLLFLLFRAAVRVHRRHFPGLERASLTLDKKSITLVRLGLHFDADLYALLNLVVYISHVADLETGSEKMGDAPYRIMVRGMHLRSAFFGIFTILSCLSRTRGIPPFTRIALAVKSMDKLTIPTDGEAMFQPFGWIRDLPLLVKATRKWNWSEFVVACFNDWDIRTSELVGDMWKKHGLPSHPNPFVSVAALHFTEPVFERLKAARALAEGYIDNSKRVLISKHSFKRAYGEG